MGGESRICLLGIFADLDDVATLCASLGRPEAECIRALETSGGVINAAAEALQARTDGYKFLATAEAWRDETGGADEVAARMRSGPTLSPRAL